MKSGYSTAIDNATAKLITLDPAAVCARTGASYDGEYRVPWFGTLELISSGNDAEQIIWLHYLISEGTRPPTGRYVAYRELNGSGFYEAAFNKRAVNPLIKRFGADPERLIAAGVSCGGSAAGMGDAAVTLAPLPHVPVTYVIWRGDDEIGPGGTILFDQTASGWLPAEDLSVLASLGVYRMIKNSK